MARSVSNHETRPSQDWVLRTDHASHDGNSLSYIDMMERSSAEERRRQRERVMMEEGKALWAAKKNEELEMEMKEQEQVRELSRLKLFGRPGHGAPTGDIRKKRFTEYQMEEMKKRAELEHNNGFNWTNGNVVNGAGSSSEHEQIRVGLHTDDDDDDPVPHPVEQPSLDLETVKPPPPNQRQHDALSFGRPGYGAPVRTKSGRLRTEIRGNPEIRFQENSSVQKSIFNNIRYQSNPELKAQYHRELSEQIQRKKEMERMEKERDRHLARELANVEGSQWGRPGPGGAYWRDSAVTGQNFFDKMGWCGSADPRKRQYEVRHTEAEDMKKEMSEIRYRKDQELMELNSGVGVELVPLLKEKQTGKPRKDPQTGYLMNHALPSTDVTKIAEAKRAEVPTASRRSPEERKQYFDTLNLQIQSRDTANEHRKRFDEEEQRRHFQNWGNYWGRPGYGAPRQGNQTQKENLMKILHYPEKAPNHVELVTLERLPVK